MEYFTVLWITILSGPLDGTVTGLVYNNLEQCEAAIEPVVATLEYDFNVACEETVLPSSSIRPKRRPEGLTNE